MWGSKSPLSSFIVQMTIQLIKWTNKKTLSCRYLWCVLNYAVNFDTWEIFQNISQVGGWDEAGQGWGEEEQTTGAEERTSAKKDSPRKVSQTCRDAANILTSWHLLNPALNVLFAQALPTPFTTCATPTTQHQHLNPGLWMAHCRVVFVCRTGRLFQGLAFLADCLYLTWFCCHCLVNLPAFRPRRWDCLSLGLPEWKLNQALICQRSWPGTLTNNRTLKLGWELQGLR